MESDSPLQSHPPGTTAVNSLDPSSLQCSLITKPQGRRSTMIRDITEHLLHPYSSKSTNILFTMSLPNV